MKNNKIVPCIWLSADQGTLSNIIAYYKTVFDNDFQTDPIVSLGSTPSGHTEICGVTLFGQKYTLMSTQKKHHPLNDAVSFVINCQDQQEIDYFWNYFTRQGKESQCGWCQDKYGLRWQIIPFNLDQLMTKPHAFDTMMQQTKIVIEAFLE